MLHSTLVRLLSRYLGIPGSDLGKAMSMNFHPFKIFAIVVLPVFLWQLGYALVHQRIRLRGGRMVYMRGNAFEFWALIGSQVWFVFCLLALIVLLPTWI